MDERWGDKRIKEENRVVIAAELCGDKPASLEINAFTKDISPSGAMIVTDRSFPVDSKLNLTLYLSRSKKVVRTPGTVRWDKKRKDGLHEVGVQFLHGIPGVLLALINYLYGSDEAIPTEVVRE
jgi:hypothetical protein